MAGSPAPLLVLARLPVAGKQWGAESVPGHGTALRENRMTLEAIRVTQSDRTCLSI